MEEMLTVSDSFSNSVENFLQSTAYTIFTPGTLTDPTLEPVAFLHASEL